MEILYFKSCFTIYANCTWVKPQQILDTQKKKSKHNYKNLKQKQGLH